MSPFLLHVLQVSRCFVDHLEMMLILRHFQWQSRQFLQSSTLLEPKKAVTKLFHAKAMHERRKAAQRHGTLSRIRMSQES